MIKIRITVKPISSKWISIKVTKNYYWNPFLPKSFNTDLQSALLLEPSWSIISQESSRSQACPPKGLPVYLHTPILSIYPYRSD
ncbi:hypothetical protein BpHYR1_025906 [Brachionus plicatilis]|uniref:Uncharacterized protein n=1 Tax=Brachionus plicatilis TaxID=10195 RepID=A0A3M7QVB0_BRAPC|nr:hypothetical protein BpHYR1_025906 [Brachionus plicatilis]